MYAFQAFDAAGDIAVSEQVTITPYPQIGTYLPTYLPINLPTFLPTYRAAYLDTFLPLSTYTPTHLGR